MNIFLYIQGLRRGKEANRLEFEAMKDPFLADALDGYTESRKNYKRQIDTLQRTVTNKCRKSPRYALISCIATGAGLIVGVALYLFILEPDTLKNLFAPSHTEKVSREPVSNTPQPSSTIGVTDSTATKEQTIEPKQQTPELKPAQPVIQKQEPIAKTPANTEKTLNSVQPTNIQETAIKPKEPENAIAKESGNLLNTIESPVKATVVAHDANKEELEPVETNTEKIEKETQQTGNSEVAAPEPVEVKPKIKGRVVDASGNPISGASVSVIGAGKRTTTNANGYFELEADNNSNLMIRSQGYDPVTTTGTTEKNMQINMQAVPAE